MGRVSGFLRGGELADQLVDCGGANGVDQVDQELDQEDGEEERGHLCGGFSSCARDAAHGEEQAVRAGWSSTNIIYLSRWNFLQLSWMVKSKGSLFFRVEMRARFHDGE
jgi:hypothetical protein